MSDWNSEQYLRFEKQRTQPALDLVQRVRPYDPRTIVDIGSGPGNSTSVLSKVFPDADLLGIDSSPNMIAKAQGLHPDIPFRLCDISALEGNYDLLFSNACLQWIPDHASLLPTLMTRLNIGGMLAVQIPMNGQEPLFRIIKEVASESRWDFSAVCFETNDGLEPDEYFDILAGCSSTFQIWETVYYHNMPSHRSLIEWVKGTRLRPYLDVLGDDDARLFEDEILERARQAYSVMKNGEVVLRFRRFFFIARK